MIQPQKNLKQNKKERYIFDTNNYIHLYYTIAINNLEEKKLNFLSFSDINLRKRDFPRTKKIGQPNNQIFTYFSDNTTLSLQAGND